MMHKADKDSIKRNNKKLILNQLKSSDFSRTEIAGRTGLSHSTVSMLVAELEGEGFIYEKSHAQSSGGRKPVILTINPECAYALLIKITRGKVAGAMVNLALQVVDEQTVPLFSGGEKAVEQAVGACLAALLTHNDRVVPRILGVGLCIQGLVDYERETVLFSSLLELRNIDIKAIICRHIDRPVYLFRDTDSLMMGEYILSDLRKNGNYAYLIADSGVGLSVMLHGNIIQMSRSGLEIGHITLEENGIRCNCGNLGCVETRVGESAANRELRRIAAEDSVWRRRADQATFAEIARAAAAGDGLCGQIMLGQGRYLGRLVSTVVNLFAPDTVFIGGPFSFAGSEVQQEIVASARAGELDILKSAAIRFTNTVDKAAFVGLADYVFGMRIFNP